MRPKNKVTIQSIADELGLSKYAVSRSLAGKSGVSEETRQRIAETADRLGYPKSPARSNGQEIAVVFYNHDPVNSELNVNIQAGVQYEAERTGVGVRIRWTDSPEAVEALAQEFAGLILVGPHPHETIARVASTNTPLVRFGWTDDLEQVDSIAGTDHDSGRAVARYLMNLGHRTIAYVYGLPFYRGRSERFYGAREVVEEQKDASLHLMQFDENTGFTRAFQNLISTGVSPTAFYCASDGLALRVVSELLALGYRIPEDLSVVGFGDYSAATHISPALTTVRQEGREMGIAAIQLLLERIEKPRLPEQPARMVRVVLRLIERRSAGPVRKDRLRLKASTDIGSAEVI